MSSDNGNPERHFATLAVHAGQAPDPTTKARAAAFEPASGSFQRAPRQNRLKTGFPAMLSERLAHGVDRPTRR